MDSILEARGHNFRLLWVILGNLGCILEHQKNEQNFEEQKNEYPALLGRPGGVCGAAGGAGGGRNRRYLERTSQPRSNTPAPLQAGGGGFKALRAVRRAMDCSLKLLQLILFFLEASFHNLEHFVHMLPTLGYLLGSLLHPWGHFWSTLATFLVLKTRLRRQRCPRSAPRRPPPI